MRTVIDRFGRVREAEVVRSLTPGLDRMTLHTVREWMFRPATLSGKPVAVYYTLTVNFTLK